MWEVKFEQNNVKTCFRMNGEYIDIFAYIHAKYGFDGITCMTIENLED